MKPIAFWVLLTDAADLANNLSDDITLLGIKGNTRPFTEKDEAQRLAFDSLCATAKRRRARRAYILNVFASGRIKREHFDPYFWSLGAGVKCPIDLRPDRDHDLWPAVNLSTR